MSEADDEPIYALGNTEPVGYVEQGVPHERATDSWFRELHDGRVEIMCKAPDFRIRVTAPEDAAWQAVELFEQWTGLTVNSERRPRRRMRTPAGQITMDELLES